MELRARIRPHSRRAAWMAALVALIASAAAGAVAPSAFAGKAKPPVIRSIAPKKLAIGQTLTIRGKHFRRGRGKNSVVFKRFGAKAVFVKADIGTTKLLTVKLPAKLSGSLAVKDGAMVPTVFRLRVLAKRLGKRFTRLSLSPTISPE